MSLKFPHDDCSLLSPFSRESDSPRCVIRRAGAVTQDNLQR